MSDSDTGRSSASNLQRTSQQAGPPAHSHKKGPWGIIVLLLIVAVGGWFGYKHWHPETPADGAGGPGKGGKGAGSGQTPPVPVVVGTVTSKDVPIYLDGLGTVQAFNSVTIRPRVDGQLLKVSFTEGSDVKIGDELALIDPAPYQAVLEQAAAKKAQEEAQLANAKVDLQRYADLLKTDSITRQVYDTQKSSVAQLEASVKADQATIDSAKVNLEYTTIRSPIDGRVGIRQVDAGNVVRASDANGLVVLTQLKPISVIFTLPEQVLGKLQQNQSEGNQFQVLAVSRDNTNTLAEGKVAVIDNQIDTATGTLKIKATFANENLRLWPGQFVNIRLLLTTRKDSAVVPASVVQRGPEGPFAFVVQPDQSVQMRPLKVAQIAGGEALIDEGLKVGEHVIVDGQYKLQPGSKVKPTEPSLGGGTNRAGANPNGKKREGKKP